MNLSDNFARSIRLTRLGIYHQLDGSTINIYEQHNVVRIGIKEKGMPESRHTVDRFTDAETLRKIESVLPPGKLLELLCKDVAKACWYYRGLADRLRRAYVEPDMPMKQYEKPLITAAREFARAVLTALDYEPVVLTVRRAKTSAGYSPIAAEAEVKLPGTGVERRIQLILDPSPYSDTGWALRINAYDFSEEETNNLHAAFPKVIQTLNDSGYTVSTLPWVGQKY